MAVDAKKAVLDPKSEFIIELAERRAYWAGREQVEYAQAYEHLLCVFTTPDKPETA